MCIKTVLCLYKCFNHLHISITYLHNFLPMKQGGDRERALRNAAIQKSCCKCDFAFVIRTCYLSKDTLKVVLLIGVLWTFDLF